MDPTTCAAVTTALDIAIARVAKQELTRLSTGLSDRCRARRVYTSLRELAGLQGNTKPTYDEWVAVFYSLWYQPAHINLAYTCAQRIPADINPIVRGEGALQVFDFGCGALATKFGLALAAADALREGSQLQTITVQSCDESEAMKDIGKKIWCDFVNEIEPVANTDPKVAAVWFACESIVFDGQVDSQESTRWLTALHVAYATNAHEVKACLNRRVKFWAPDVVLVTSHPSFTHHRFCPQCGYCCCWDETFKCSPGPYTPDVERLRLEGMLSNTSKLRLQIGECISNSLQDCERSFVSRYLQTRAVHWTGGTDLGAVVYVKQPN